MRTPTNGENRYWPGFQQKNTGTTDFKIQRVDRTVGSQPLCASNDRICRRGFRRKLPLNVSMTTVPLLDQDAERQREATRGHGVLLSVCPPRQSGECGHDRERDGRQNDDRQPQ